MQNIVIASSKHKPPWLKWKHPCYFSVTKYLSLEYTIDRLALLFQVFKIAWMPFSINQKVLNIIGASSEKMVPGTMLIFPPFKTKNFPTKSIGP